MAEVVLREVSVTYASRSTPSVKDVNLRINPGELFVLLGGPGSGKTSILRAIQGMERIKSGTISIGGRDVTKLDPSERNVAIAFETYALYPHMTVEENMGFALRLLGRSTEEIAERVRAAAQRLTLTDLLASSPNDLTGIQRQTVALARALVRNPSAFLMDEPLKNLPAEQRETTGEEIRTLQRELGITTIYATADPHSAVSLADRIAVLDCGEITEVVSPEELRARLESEATAPAAPGVP